MKTNPKTLASSLRILLGGVLLAGVLAQPASATPGVLCGDASNVSVFFDDTFGTIGNSDQCIALCKRQSKQCRVFVRSATACQVAYLKTSLANDLAYCAEIADRAERKACRAEAGAGFDESGSVYLELRGLGYSHCNDAEFACLDSCFEEH